MKPPLPTRPITHHHAHSLRPPPNALAATRTAPRPPPRPPRAPRARAARPRRALRRDGGGGAADLRLSRGPRQRRGLPFTPPRCNKPPWVIQSGPSAMAVRQLWVAKAMGKCQPVHSQRKLREGQATPPVAAAKTGWQLRRWAEAGRWPPSRGCRGPTLESGRLRLCFMLQAASLRPAGGAAPAARVPLARRRRGRPPHSWCGAGRAAGRGAGRGAQGGALVVVNSTKGEARPFRPTAAHGNSKPIQQRPRPQMVPIS
jgi:hypothetical protein